MENTIIFDLFLNEKLQSRFVFNDEDQLKDQ